MRRLAPVWSHFQAQRKEVRAVQFTSVSLIMNTRPRSQPVTKMCKINMSVAAQEAPSLRELGLPEKKV